MSTIVSKFALVTLAMASTALQAELVSLGDEELSGVDGAGVGLVFEDFMFEHGHDPSNDKTFRITGLTSTDGSDVIVNVNQLYIAKSGSNRGTTLDTVNLGRLTNPYEIKMIDGNTIGLPNEAVLEFSAPDKVAAGTGYSCVDPTLGLNSGDCSSRPDSAVSGNGERPDIGLELEVNVAGSPSRDINFNVEAAVFDGSYLRLWGDEDRTQMAAEIRLNFYTPNLEISTCSQANQGCSASVQMRDFEMELALGHTFQPLYIGVDQISGGLTLEIPAITHEFMSNISTVTGLSDGSPQGDAAFAFFEDYYQNDVYRSNISVGEVNIGGTNLGSAKIEGMLIQYLDVEFRDLTP